MPASRTARTICGAALALGLLGDHLFRVPVWGLNLAVWAIAVAGHGLMLAYTERAAPPAGRRPPWPWLAAAFFAGMWTLRDAPLLLAVDLLAALALLSLPLVQADGIALRAAGAVATLLAPVRAAWHAAIGGFPLVAALRPLALAGPAVAQRATAIGVGLLLAVPPVLVFGGLFASADPLFSAAISSLIQVDLGPLVSHLFVVGALTWTTAGYLWAIVRPAPVPEVALPRLSIGVLPVFTAVGATAFVFTLFVATQAGSLFGGEAFVRAETGLTYAEYARQGFFEMVFASALSLPVVYVAPFLGGGLPDSDSRSLRALLTVQLGLTALVVASALWRMGLYVRVYGLTEDRLYGTAVMVWIAATIGVFGRTVLRERPRGAAFGSVVAAVIALAMLNLGNPKALIARYNLRHQDRRAADVAHLVELGGDAVPVLVSRLHLMAPEARCQLAVELMERHSEARGDWRGWNLARARARKAVRGLEGFASSCNDPRGLTYRPMAKQ